RHGKKGECPGISSNSFRRTLRHGFLSRSPQRLIREGHRAGKMRKRRQVGRNSDKKPASSCEWSVNGKCVRATRSWSHHPQLIDRTARPRLHARGGSKPHPRHLTCH